MIDGFDTAASALQALVPDGLWQAGSEFFDYVNDIKNGAMAKLGRALASRLGWASLTGDDWPMLLSAQVDADSASLAIVPHASLTWFRGHFPGHPVLAGVHVQIGIRSRDTVDGQVALGKDPFHLLYRHVGEKVLERIVLAAIRQGDTLESP